MKKILFVIAYNNFKDEEYFIPKEVFENNGFSVTTASNAKGIALGVSGGEVEVNHLISEVNMNDFDALVFAGGPGCLDNLDNDISYNLINKAKIIGAICISPVILAKAGILKNKRATVWSSNMDKSPINILSENGAIFEDKDVVVDGNIITANGPDVAEEFGVEVVNLLTKK